MINNLINIKTHHQEFKDKAFRFSVSSRHLCQDIDILNYLKILYMLCDPEQIESVFGHTTIFSRLHGGRSFNLTNALTDAHIRTMESKDIHLALTLTNHFFDKTAYKESCGLLKKHHKPGNSIICTNDELAVHIKNDFPDYEIKASLIKQIDTIEKVERALELYDSLTIPMEMNDNDLFLQHIAPKGRMILFANASCAYTCPARTCYQGISQRIFNQPAKAADISKCSKSRIPREDLGLVHFNVKKFSDMGFRRFKLIPSISNKKKEQVMARHFSNKKKYFFNTLKSQKPIFYFCSYPKCGRTWVRFLIAQYLNHKKKLNMNIDLHSIFSILPNEGNNPLKGINRYRYSDNSDMPLILFTHSEYKKNRLKDAQIFFMLRSVFDVVVSDYFHNSKLLKQYKENLHDFIRDPNGGLERYLNYLNSWSPYMESSGSFIFTYEMLHKNTKKTLMRLLEYLKLDTDFKTMDRAIHHSSFERMQTIEKKKGIAGHPGQSRNTEAKRVRKGIVGGYSDYLDKADIQYVQDRCREVLLPETKKRLRPFNICPGC